MAGLPPEESHGSSLVPRGDGVSRTGNTAVDGLELELEQEEEQLQSQEQVPTPYAVGEWKAYKKRVKQVQQQQMKQAAQELSGGEDVDKERTPLLRGSGAVCPNSGEATETPTLKTAVSEGSLEGMSVGPSDRQFDVLIDESHAISPCALPSAMVEAVEPKVDPEVRLSCSTIRTANKKPAWPRPSSLADLMAVADQPQPPLSLSPRVDYKTSRATSCGSNEQAMMLLQPRTQRGLSSGGEEPNTSFVEETSKVEAASDDGNFNTKKNKKRNQTNEPIFAITGRNFDTPFEDNSLFGLVRHKRPYRKSRSHSDPTTTENSSEEPNSPYPNVDPADLRTGVPRSHSEGSTVRRCADEGDARDDTGLIRLGICAMDKKARSKPMSEILSRLDESRFQIVFYGDNVILHEPIEKWPVVDVLVAFHSKGYPLDKAERYVELRNPYVINDLKMQRALLDRRRVYDLLEKSGIDVPRHVYMSRDGYVSEGSGDGASIDESEEPRDDKLKKDAVPDLIEHDDHIEINGVIIRKPFVEKPVDADDHNINIYYPTSAGGGCKKLFRKIGDRSSEFYPDINEVRRDGSYIYEEFVETQGTDVKMYTVGSHYGHAEARKSPTVDGKVERNSDGKEVRFPVILTLREKEIARRIVVVFKQQVCGFDLLRVQEDDSLMSYVCDVNGWSFVKNSRKYYDDCAQILSEHMVAAIKPKALQCFSAIDPMVKASESAERDGSPDRPNGKSSAHEWANRMLLGDLTAADNSAKDYGGDDASDGMFEGTEHGLAHEASTLRDGAIPVRQISDRLAQEPPSICTSAASSVMDENEAMTRSDSFPTLGTPQEELRCVIAVIRHGDRTPKQKLKVNISEPQVLDYFHSHSSNCRKDLKVKDKKPMYEFLDTVQTMIFEKETQGCPKEERDLLVKLLLMRDVLQRWKIGGLNRKLQLKPQQWTEIVDENGESGTRCTEVLLILKWGGNLTKLGERQSIHLGQRLRHEMYPDAPGGGILRLHSTFRHDLKIKTSDEGRVMKTAAAFAKGLLELEGEIPPILVSLVHKEKESQNMLDTSGNKEVKNELEQCKMKINENLQTDFDYDASTEARREQIVGPREMRGLHDAMKQVGNPRQTLFGIHQAIRALLDQLDEMLGLMASEDEKQIEGGEGLQGENEADEALSGIKLYKGETLLELTERWRSIHKKLYDDETDTFELSRIPDVHDNARFDMLHNPHLGLTTTLKKLYNLAKVMADCVVPQEYGTTVAEKRSIGSKVCRALLEKLKFDLSIARTDNQVDMRYMINMDYSADLPISTMGRRIRTRLYFTSESHLHTLLNVLRFPSSEPNSGRSPLSRAGQDILNETSEICYLTQVVFRLFEDTKKAIDDPKRFRVEIQFSPGATATPEHMAELDRDLDSSRFDTVGLETISRDNLTCKEVEEYFTVSIMEGKTDDDDEVASMVSTVDGDDKRNATKTPTREMPPGTPPPTQVDRPDLSPPTPRPEEEAPPLELELSEGETKAEDSMDRNATESASLAEKEEEMTPRSLEFDASNEPPPTDEDDDVRRSLEEPEDDLAVVTRVLTRKLLWGSVAALSFVTGIGCLWLAKELHDNHVGGSSRWSRR